MTHLIDNINSNSLITTSQATKKPLKNLLDNWQVIIAKEVVKQWQQSSTNSKLEENLLNSLALINDQSAEVVNSLENKLELKISQIKNTLGYTEFNLNNNDELLNSLKEIIDELDSSLKSINSKKAEVIQELISFNWKQVTSSNFVTLFQKLIKKLNTKKTDFTNKKNIYQRNEASAWQAYFILNRKLQKVTVNSSRYNYYTESKWRAIFICFEAKLKITYYQDCIQREQDLIDQLQTYYKLLLKSSQILDHLQESLNKKATLSLQSLKIISLPVFMYLDKVNADDQKKEIENWIGHSLNHWGLSNKSWQEIEKKLLENLESKVLTMYQDFRQFFKN